MMKKQEVLVFLLALASAGKAAAFLPVSTSPAPRLESANMGQTGMAAESIWFGGAAMTTTAKSRNEVNDLSLEQLKAQILQLGAALDRGQAYNPTSGRYYETSMETAKDRIQALVTNHPKPAMTLSDMEGEWELVLTTGEIFLFLLHT